MRKTNHLFILTNGKVAAIDKKTGNIVWEIKLKEYVKYGTSMSIGQINVEDDKIYIGSMGILLCLSTKDGSLIWKNELKGWGYGYVTMANVGAESNAAAIAMAAAASAAAAGAANM